MDERAELLIVDDDRSLTEILSMSLRDAGLDVRLAHDGRRGWEAFCERTPDLVILDLLMPELDGLHLCQMIREAGSAVPVIMLTSRDQEMDKVLGLELGADDYMTKPFSTRELIARIRAALRRTRLTAPGSGEGEAIRRSGALRLDRARREVRLGDQELKLTATEFELLWALVERQGRVLERDRLIDLVYGVDVVVTDRTIDTFVKRLRRKLSQVDPSCQPIETVRGVGYKFTGA